MDKFGGEKKKIVTVLCILGLLGSIIFTTQGGLFWLDIVDHFLNHYGLVVVGIGECILVGWLFKLEVIRRHINKVSSFKLGTWWDVLIKYIVPMILSLIILWDLYHELKQPYEDYSWTSLILIGRDWVVLTLIAGIVFAMRPWKTDLLDQGRESKATQKPAETGKRDYEKTPHRDRR
jgi:NSS family neurotransmitter:Na+ symporter